jgi:hypothetical protein
MNSKVDKWKNKTENTVTQINAILATVGKQWQDNQIIDIPISITPVKPVMPDMPSAGNTGGGGGKEEESEIERIIRQAREAVAEYGKSEAELTEEKIKGLGATTGQITQYSSLAQILQDLKDAEEERNKIKKDTADVENQTGDYIRQLEELRIKYDEIENDEVQLLELERARAIAEIENSQAAAAAKEDAIKALKEYYDAAVEFASREAEVDNIAAFKKRLEEKLDAEKGYIRKRIEVLKNGINEIESIEGISAEQRAQLEKELSDRIKEEAEKQKQLRIDFTMESLSAVQEITGVFTDIARQKADEEAERETARLEAEKASKAESLIDTFNKEIKAADMTEEAKQQLKETFLAQYKKNEKDYTAAIEQEEEKRKEAAKKAAIADKAISAATAAVNSYMAFTGVLAAEAPLGPVVAAIQAGSILALGLAQQAKILSTPIAAETGGRFMVPNTGGGVDGGYLRVNSDEVVDVTPRGESASPYVIHNVLMIEHQVVYDVVNEGIRSGDIRLGANV